MAPLAGQPCGWLDVKVIYARVSAHNIINTSSDFLLFACPPRDISSELEVNGAKISPSEDVVLTMRKDRTDSESSEATFVSTDRLRLRRSLHFKILHEGEQLVCGALVFNKSKDGDFGAAGHWNLECTCTTSSSWSGFVVKSFQDLSEHAVQPSLELCIVAKCDGMPVMLTETVQLTARRKNHWKGELDAIPESEELDRASSNGAAPVNHSQESFHPVPEDKGLMPLEKAVAPFPGMFDFPNGYMDSDEGNGELSWFNAGVRVGVGLGLGMCIGVGIGVGLLVRTYQSTARSFRRTLF